MKSDVELMQKAMKKTLKKRYQKNYWSFASDVLGYFVLLVFVVLTFGLLYLLIVHPKSLALLILGVTMWVIIDFMGRLFYKKK